MYESNGIILGKLFLILLGFYLLIPGFSGLVRGVIAFRVRARYDLIEFKGRKARFYGALFLVASISIFLLVFIFD